MLDKGLASLAHFWKIEKKEKKNSLSAHACVHIQKWFNLFYIYIYIYVTVISLLVPLPTHMEATYNTEGLFKTKESRKGKQNGRYGQESEQKVNFLILH